MSARATDRKHALPLTSVGIVWSGVVGTVIGGHSIGGLLSQILAGRGLSAATVAIDPAPFRGMLPLPTSSLRSASPVLGNLANYRRAVPLSYDQC